MPDESSQMVLITAEDFTEDPPRGRSSIPHPLKGLPNKAVKARWVKYRQGQVFRVAPTSGGEPTFIPTYEKLAKVLRLSLSTVRQYFAQGGGKFLHVVNGVQVEVTRGRVANGGE